MISNVIVLVEKSGVDLSCGREQLVQHHALQQPYLKVDMNHLTAFDEELAYKVTERPAHVLPIFERQVTYTERAKPMFALNV